MEVIEATKNRVVLKGSIAKSGQRYAIFFPATIARIAEMMREKEVKVTVEVIE